MLKLLNANRIFVLTNLPPNNSLPSTHPFNHPPTKVSDRPHPDGGPGEEGSRGCGSDVLSAWLLSLSHNQSPQVTITC